MLCQCRAFIWSIEVLSPLLPFSIIVYHTHLRHYLFMMLFAKMASASRNRANFSTFSFSTRYGFLGSAIMHLLAWGTFTSFPTPLRDQETRVWDWKQLHCILAIPVLLPFLLYGSFWQRRHLYGTSYWCNLRITSLCLTWEQASSAFGRPPLLSRYSVHYSMIQQSVKQIF